MYSHTESLAPQPAPDLEMEPIGDRQLVLRPIFTGELFGEVVQYSIIVEAYEKRLTGRVRRRYHEAFTKNERKKIASWHTKFRKWHLVTGTPRHVAVRPETVTLLQLAVHFFATI